MARPTVGIEPGVSRVLHARRGIGINRGSHARIVEGTLKVGYMVIFQLRPEVRLPAKAVIEGQPRIDAPIILAIEAIVRNPLGIQRAARLAEGRGLAEQEVRHGEVARELAAKGEASGICTHKVSVLHFMNPICAKLQLMVAPLNADVVSELEALRGY